MPSPFGLNCGERWLRSRPAVRIFGVPPATGTIARLFVPYQMSFGSPPCRYPIDLPSGLNTGEPSDPCHAVSFRTAPPFDGSTTRMSLLSLPSGLSVRFALKARSLPSGDHTGAPSSQRSDVTCTSVFDAMSKTWMWRLIVSRYPSPSRLNWRRVITCGLGFLSASDPVCSFGSGSETSRASFEESGDQARAEAPVL